MNEMKTLSTPLTLTAHFFPSVHIEANKDLQIEDMSEVKWGEEIIRDVTITKTPDEIQAIDYQVILRITTSPKEGATMAYEIDLEVAGFFKVAEGFPEEHEEEMISRTAPAILYSAAREFIISITQRGPYPHVYLPTVSFIPAPDCEDNTN
jgi:preprotein translocase subunit SecB